MPLPVLRRHPLYVLSVPNPRSLLSLPVSSIYLQLSIFKCDDVKMIFSLPKRHGWIVAALSQPQSPEFLSIMKTGLKTATRARLAGRELCTSTHTKVCARDSKGRKGGGLEDGVNLCGGRCRFSRPCGGGGRGVKLRRWRVPVSSSSPPPARLFSRARLLGRARQSSPCLCHRGLPMQMPLAS